MRGAQCSLLIMLMSVSALTVVTVTGQTTSSNVNSVPFFSTTSYSTMIPENFVEGTVVETVQAVDADGDQVSYVVDDSTDIESRLYFSLNKTTGAISVRSPLGLTTQALFTLRIHAEDNRGGRSLVPASVNISVEHNIGGPTLSSQTFIIKENSSVGSTVYTLQAGDPDFTGPAAFRNLTYTLLGNNVAKEYFKIDFLNGKVILIKRLDTLGASRPDSYNLTVRVADQGYPPKTTTASLILRMDRNYFTPVWEKQFYSAVIPETLPKGASILQVRAIDNDTTSPENVVHYLMWELNDASPMEYYGLEKETGVVFLKKSLLTTNKTSYGDFLIRGEDQGARQLLAAVEAYVTITVARNLHAPIFANSSYKISINNVLQPGDFVIQLSASDADTVPPLNTITYTITGDEKSKNMFSIDNKGQIRVKGNLSTSPDELFIVRVMACDAGAEIKCAVGEAEIRVNRNLHLPVFEKERYNATVLETQTMGIPFFTVKARDSDAQEPYNVVKYAMSGESDAFEFFTVDEDSGGIIVKKPLLLDTSGKTFYRVTVRASDGSTPPQHAIRDAQVDITINRNMNGPVFSKETEEIGLREDQALGQTFYTVRATDKDPPGPFNKITYEILGTSKYFSINNSTGELKVIRDLTDTAQYIFNVRVLAKDGGIPFKYSMQTVRITVNRNFHGPESTMGSNFEITINEDTQWGVPIFKWNFTDKDRSAPNNKINYNLIGDNTATKCFYIDQTTGVVSLKASLFDFPGNPCPAVDRYSLIVVAGDEGVPQKKLSREASLVVRVNRNKNAPRITNLPSSVNIREDRAVNSSVFIVRAEDQDTSAPMNVVKFRITGDGSAADFFKIDEKSGEIRVKASLHTEPDTNYRVRVVAYDGSVPPKSATSTLIVNVEHNLNAPVFEQTNRNLTIRVTQTLGVPIFTVRARDTDLQRPYNQIRYDLEQSSAMAKQYFAISETTGEIYVRSPLQIIIKSFQLLVSASDLGSPSKKSAVPLTIDVTVLQNEHCPVWKNTTYSAQITPDAGVGSAVMRVSATDADSPDPQFGGVLYEPTPSGVAKGLFRLDVESGIIQVSGDLTKDRSTLYELPIVASDRGRCKTTATATIFVLRNRAAPVFTKDEWTADIFENRGVGLKIPPLVTVTASDTDNQAPFNTVRYDFSASSNHTDKFMINSNTGAIYLRISLQGLTETLYELQVIARDGSDPPRVSPVPATVRVTVYRNQHTPYFINEPYERTVSGSQLNAGSEVITVAARDLDAVEPYNTLKYSIIGDDTAPVFFELERESNGKIVVKGDLSGDTGTVYRVRVLVQDGGSPARTNTTVVTVHVNRNSHAPEFPQRTLTQTIPETTPIAVAFMTVTASDRDQQAPYNVISYQLQGDATVLQYFYINNTGSISLLKPMTGVTQSVFQFNVTARDGGGIFERSSTFPVGVTVTITRNEFGPKFTGQYDTNIKGSHTGNVVKVQAEDQDTEATFSKVTYRLIGDGSSTSFFAVDKDSGQISVKPGSDLDSDTQTVYYLRVLAEDNGQPAKSDETVIKVTVARNVAGPAFESGKDNLSILETLSIGSVIERYSAKDDSSGGTVKYSITGEGNAVDYFFMNSETGQLVLKKSVQGITENSFKLNVTATDNGKPPLSTTIQVTVTILRDSTTLSFSPSVYTAEISENKPVNESFINLSTTPSLDVFFRLDGYNSGPNFFAVNRLTGQIYVKTSLKDDPLKLRTYRLRVEAKYVEVTEQKVYADVTITVRRNENAPQFNASTYSRSIPTNFPLGEKILRVFASDADQGDSLTFRIVENSPITDLFYIHPRTGNIMVKQPFPSTATNFQYNFQVQAVDSGEPSKSANGEVRITFLKDQLPSFSLPAFVEVPENTTTGQVVLTVQAADSDIQGSLVYELLDSYPSSSFLKINSSTGVITVSNPNVLYSDDQLTYTIRVRVYDSAKPKAFLERSFQLRVLRNPNAPVFSPSLASLTIDENIFLGSSIIDVNATDADGDRLRYSIEGGDTEKRLFFINPETGLISLIRTLKGLTETQYTITVGVSDNRNPEKKDSMTITVTVTRDTSKPEFRNAPYTLSILSTQAVDSQLQPTPGSVQAVDSDLKGKIQYEISGDYPATDFFRINADTGVVTIKSALAKDTAKLSQYTVRLKAYDSKYPDNFAETTLTVSVNHNPSRPVFIESSYKATISEQIDVGTSVLNVTATDADKDDLSYIMGSSSSAESFEYFFVAQDTGIIYTRKPLTTTSTRTFSFRVTVRDGGKPEQTASADVTVTVNRDQFPPRFTNIPTTLQQIADNTQLNAEVFTVTAEDQDLMGTLKFELIGDPPSQDFFSMSSDGKITVKKDLSTDTSPFYIVRVKVYDTSNPQQSVSSTVRIPVNHNVNAPVFDSVEYSKTVSDTLQVGSSILRVNATDADQDGVTYSFQGDVNSNSALAYFSLNPVSGVVYLKKSLQSDPNKEENYFLRVHAFDNGNPARRSARPATVVITARRDRGAPFFEGVPYNAVTTENAPVGTKIIQLSARDNDRQGQIVYRLTGDSLGPYFFELNSTTGEIKIRNDLKLGKDFKYTLRVEAYDTVYPLRIVEALVEVRVVRNVNVPQFSHGTTIPVTIYDTAPLGDIIVSLNATDADQDSIRYTAVADQAAMQYFYVDADSGEVSIKKKLYPGTQKQYTLTVEANDQGNPAKSVNALVRINVIRSVESPGFSGEPYTVNDLPESTSTGDGIITVTASDSDIRGKLRYEIIGDYPSPNFFTINPDNGTISMTTPVRDDPFKRETYLVRVLVYDTAYPDQRRETVVTINVRRNANSPQMTPGSVQVSLDQGHPMGVDIFDFNATDADNDKITYSLTGSAAAQQVFYVHPETGVVTLKKRLTETTENSYQLTIQACDDNKPQKCATSVLRVDVSRSQQPPVFTGTPYTVTINELQNVDDVIFTVKAKDDNLKGSIRFGQDGISPAPDFFRVDTRTGEVKVQRNLREDRRLTYILRVTVIDSEFPDQVRNTILTIIVERNANAPVMERSSYDVTIPEKQTLGRAFLTVNASDADGDKVRFSLSGDQSILEYFFIDTSSGAIAVKKPLTDNNAVEYRFSVIVSDQAFPQEKTATATVLVRVTRDSRTPVFRDSNITREIPESQPVNSVILTLRADDDNQARMRYEIVGVYPGQSFFRIGETSGELSVSRDLTTDNLQLTSYLLRVQAYDSGYPDNRATASIYITVQRNVNRPLFVPSATYTASIGESHEVGSGVIKVSAEDKDKNDEIQYSIVNGTNGGNEIFMIDRKTGQIILRKSLTGGSGNYLLTVLAEDQRGKTSYAVVSIDVTNDRRPPTFQQLPYTVDSLPENINNFTDIVRVVAVNPNPNSQGNIQYRIIGIYPADKYFYINPNSGQMKTLGSLEDDPLKLKTYTVRVEAYDSADPSISATVDITIPVTRNVFAPEFGQDSYTKNIAETYPVGQLVLKVNATDKNVNDKILYEFVINDNLLTNKPNEFFWINPDTGEILLRSDLAGSVRTLFKFDIRARDQSDPEKSSTTSVTINVDRSQFPPTFSRSQYFAEIPESSPVNGSAITRVSADDQDKKGIIVYEVVGDFSAPGYFRMDQDGRVYVKSSLLGDIQTRYELRVQAYDSGNPLQKATAVVIITVKRNENAPRFPRTEYTLTVNERIPLASMIINVNATDADGDSVVYRLKNTGLALQYFSIHPTTGVITVIKPLTDLSVDISEVVLFIEASDGRRTPKYGETRVRIIINKDTRMPVFRNTPYNDARVSENARVGDVFYDRVLAEDADLMGEIRYKVLGDRSALYYFSVDEKNGQISVKADLKTDTAAIYQLRIGAYDSENPEKVASRVVTISVSRNENAPRFDRSSYGTTVSENLGLGAFIMDVNATDADNDTLRYSILGDSAAAEYFYISGDSGVITLKKLLTTSTQRQYNVRVQVRDQATPEKTSEVNVQVNVIRDTSPPRFTGPGEVGTVVDHPMNRSVVTVQVEDADLQGTTVFELTGMYPAQNFFKINNSTGVITLTRSLREDSLRLTRYTLRVEAYDSAFPARRATRFIVVFVNRNANNPAFEKSRYEKTINEKYPVVTPVVTVSASDPDKDTITYKLEGDANTLNFFYVNSAGEIELRKPLTNDTNLRYQMDVVASDQGKPVGTARASVVIIVNRDRFPPRFSRSKYTQRISDNARIDDGIFTVTARDDDLKGKMTYNVIGNPPGPTYFRVERESGSVFVKGNLKEDRGLQYTLKIEAYDSVFPDNKAYADLVIIVNRNTNGPRFSSSTYERTVLPNIPLGTEIITFQASDDDNDVLKYQFSSGENCTDYFFVDPSSGLVSLKRRLDDIKKARFDCVVEARDQGYPKENTATATLIIYVRRNLPLPVFGESPYIRSISESLAVNSTVVLITSNFREINGQPRYQIDGQYPGDNFFAINPSTGVITVKQDLRADSQRLTSYRLYVTVYDSDLPILRKQVELIINVRRNENKPVFKRSTYRVTINETYPVGLSIVQVEADDADEKDQIKYRIINTGDVQNYFYINPDSGVLSLKRSVKQHSQSLYRVIVQASDQQDPPQLTNVDVFVTVPRDQSRPSFEEQYRPTITENTLVNTTIVTVAARDNDLLGSLKYRIIGFYPSDSYFGIDSNTGAIFLKGDLKADSLQTGTYTVRVEAYDTAYPDRTSFTDVIITVVRNPNTPVFSQDSYSKTINEKFSIGGEVMSVQATDDDKDALLYSMVGTSEDQKYFYLNPDTGKITLISSLTETNTLRFQFRVTASDQRKIPKTASANVTIFIARDQQPPRFINIPYRKTVSENSAVNSTITTVTAEDPDKRGQIVYELLDVAPGSNFFTLNSKTGEIHQTQPLDSGTASVYTLYVRAFDSGNPDLKVQTTVTITVTRNEYKPEFFPERYFATVSEHNPIGTNVTKVSATDKDKPGLKSKITYALVGDGTATEFFFVHPDTGEISVAKKLTEDVSKSESYTLRVVARDQGTPQQSSTAVVTVTVVRNKRQPAFVKPASYVITIPETHTPSTRVITVTAADSDPQGPNSKVVYEIVGTSDAMSFFTINPDNGVISLAKSLFTTTLNNFVITVKASDHGVPPLSSQAQVIVTINREKSIPVFNQTEYQVQKPEDLPLGADIVTVAATDKDCPVKYTITGDGRSTEFFQVNGISGKITLKKLLTEDISTDYIIRVVAEDTCNPHQRNFAFVRLNVLRNGVAPRFSQSEYTVSIKEIQPLGIPIITLNATDNDKGSGGEVRYSLDAATSTPVYVDKYFFINPITGAISVITTLTGDSAKMEEYLLTVVAKDNGYPPLSSQSKVRVKVSRNINPPVFSKRLYRVTVNETLATGENVLRVNATDADQHSITFTVIGNAPGPDYFRVDSSTGQITVKNPLTYGSDTQYTLIITAVDNASPPQTDKATIIITVVRNPSTPRFILNFYNVTINEYDRVQTPVVDVRATDGDNPQSPSGTLRYEMKSITPEATTFFIISPNNGRITIAQPLSLDESKPKRAFFQLEVTASDQGIPKRSSSVKVQINVRRNKYKPVFAQPRYNVTVDSRDAAGTIILSVQASDADSLLQPQSPNSQIRYEIDPSDTVANKFFSIQAQRGSISLSQPLVNDQDLRNVYEFTVFARDQGQPVQSAGVQVIVSVTRYAIGGVGRLGFHQSVYRVTIEENTLVSTKVLDLPVVYKDENKNVECYFISGDPDGHFNLETTNENNCILKVHGSIDYEKKTSYTLKISVRQVARGKRQAAVSFGIVTVFVEVIDINDNAPQFIFPPYPDSERTSNKYFGAVSETAVPFTTIMTVKATDIDSGVNSAIRYGITSVSSTQNYPFMITQDEGSMLTTKEFANSTLTPKYRFGIHAENHLAPLARRLKTETEVIMNIITDIHRMIMVVGDSSPNTMYQNRQEIINTLQELTGHIIIIERIEDRRFVLNQKIKVDDTGTDVWFVAVNTTTFDLVPRESLDSSVMGVLAQQKVVSAMQGAGVANVELVRAPMDPRVGALLFVNKTYVSILESPWAALLAVAALIVFFCIVGMIVICFTWARYKRYAQRYSRMYVPPTEPVFMEPPSFLKEYETQSLAMYVPPDETMQELGEINLNFEAEDDAVIRMSGMETTGGASVTATSATERKSAAASGGVHWNGEAGLASAVNPIYTDGGQGGQIVSSHSSQSHAIMAGSSGHNEATITTSTTYTSHERQEASYYRETTTPL